MHWGMRSGRLVTKKGRGGIRRQRSQGAGRKHSKVAPGPGGEGRRKFRGTLQVRRVDTVGRS